MRADFSYVNKDVVGALSDSDRRFRFDLEWNDKDLIPEVVSPDVAFLFQRMNKVTLAKVNPAPGERILDIGCGRAFDDVELAKEGAEVIGLEPSNIMIEHAKDYVYKNRANVFLVRGVGEYLPFKDQSINKVVCKGALDHFFDPTMVIQQIARVLNPRGRAIIAIANFESLGFRLGRMIWWFRKQLGFRPSEGRMPWDIPPDHTYKFDYSVLRRLVGDCLQIEQVSGISLFFGLPWWGMLLAKCPGKIAFAALNFLDRVARLLPLFSDVIVIVCTPKSLHNVSVCF